MKKYHHSSDSIGCHGSLAAGLLLRRPNANGDSNAYPRANGHAHANPHADGDSNANTRANADPRAQHANTSAYPYSRAYANHLGTGGPYRVLRSDECGRLA